MEVTALVLTVGEKSTEEAIRRLRAQTASCLEIIVVRNVTPFHKAINQGISQVKTPFFIQCDADMLLDPDCVETMQKFIRDDVAVLIGYLSDELLGTVQAVKMFRTECVKNMKFTSTISPDTDCINRLSKMGWQFVFVSRGEEKYGHAMDVLGSHNPEYTPSYTFEKFKLEGSRIRYRGVSQEFISCLEKLKQSKHPMALFALIGLCHGLFGSNKKGGLHPYSPSKDFELLEKFMTSMNPENSPFAITKDR
jgi:glycosyltransferase involved in cell wall biosynthesis